MLHVTSTSKSTSHLEKNSSGSQDEDPVSSQGPTKIPAKEAVAQSSDLLAKPVEIVAVCAGNLPISNSRQGLVNGAQVALLAGC